MFLICICSCSVQFSCSILYETLQPHGLRMPGLPVHKQLPEFTQTHIHWVSDAYEPLHPLFSRSPSTFNLSQHQGLSNESVLHNRWPKYWSSASTSALPMNIQYWFSLGWPGWISLPSKGLSRVFSNTTVKSINYLLLSFLYSPTLTSVHDYWKNHNLD